MWNGRSHARDVRERNKQQARDVADREILHWLLIDYGKAESCSTLIERSPSCTCLTRPYEIDAGNYAGSAGAGAMDPSAPPASRSRCGGSEVFGGPPFARTARQWSSLARGRSGAGKNAHCENDGRLHSNRISKIAIHARSFAGGFARHAYLQPAHRRVYHKARSNFLKFDPGR